MDAPFRRLGAGLHDDGWQVLPAEGKAVKIKDWESIELTRTVVERWCANGKGELNLSIRTGLQADGSFIVLVDLDSYSKALSKALIESFRKTFKVEPLIRIGQAPKLGLVVRTDIASRKITSPLWKAPEDTKENPMRCKVEVLATGQQFVAFGIHPDTAKPYRWQGETPVEVEPWAVPVVKLKKLETWVEEVVPTLIPPSWVKKGAGRTGGTLNPDLTDEEIDDFVRKRPMGLDEVRIREVLEDLDPSMCDEHDEWIMVGQALHHETQGDDWGLELWIEWSRGSQAFQEGVCERRWETFNCGRADGVTFRTVTARTKKPDLQSVKTGFETLEEMTEALPELGKAFVGMVCPIERDQLLRGLVREYSQLFGAPVTKASFREKLINAASVEAAANVSEIPDWARRHVWVQGENAFRVRTSKQKVSSQGLDMQFGDRSADLRFVNPATGATFTRTPSAAWRTWDKWEGSVAEKVIYWPREQEVVFRMDGVRYFNLYDKRSRLNPAEDWTPEGLRIKAAIDRHMEILIPKREYREQFLSWWAYQYQSVGHKIMWSPVLVGCHGDGKNTFVELFQMTVGSNNVGLLTGHTVATSPFTSYAGQYQVVFVDELFHPGEKVSVAEKLKGLIGSNYVEVHAKGKDPMKVPNCTNYYFTSNHRDCLIIQETERRYFVLFSPITKIDQLDEILREKYGTTASVHFSELTDLARKHPDQVAKYFSEYPITKAFEPFKEAPRTEFRAEIAKFSVAEEDSGFASIMSNGKLTGVASDVISQRDVFEHMGVPSHHQQRRTRTLKKTLNAAGYVEWRHGKNLLSWNGGPTRIWVTPEWVDKEVAQIRARLDTTIQMGGFDEEDDL